MAYLTFNWVGDEKILITGSLGYIGSVLTDYLSKEGYEIVGWDAGYFLNAELYKPISSETVNKDVRKLRGEDLSGIDAVIHLAGISNDPVGKLEAASVYDPTRKYSLDIARLCKNKGIKFIFASSCSVYGLGSNDFLNEGSNTNPQTFYSLNKLQIEEDLQAISDKDFSPIALRFATVFGASPRIRFDVVINMLAGMAVSSGKIVLNSNGLSWRPNLHILDACKAIRYAIDYEHVEGGLLVLNVGDNKNNLKVIDIAKTVQNSVKGCELKFLSENPELDTEGLIRDRKVKEGLDSRTYKVSFHKIETVFIGFKCDWSIQRGVDEMVDIFKNIPLTPKIFQSRGFYRLQRLEDLLEAGMISERLEWIK